MWYPPADITWSEFEEWVHHTFELAATQPGEYVRVSFHDRVVGTDGSYVFDATIRCRLAELDLLIIVEAKRHKNPIKRELVQALHSKLLSVGAHKAVMVSTARYQRGALRFAKAHGIALWVITEGRFTIEVRTAGPPPPLSREEASQIYDTPTFVASAYELGDTPTSTLRSLVTPDYLRELLAGTPAR
jgi:hypothetical protein